MNGQRIISTVGDLIEELIPLDKQMKVFIVREGGTYDITKTITGVKNETPCFQIFVEGEEHDDDDDWEDDDWEDD